MRFSSAEPPHIMEVKQTEIVDLEMTSPAQDLLPEAECREDLFSNTWQGRLVHSNPLLLLFTPLPSFVEIAQFHKMNVEEKKRPYSVAFYSHHPALPRVSALHCICVRLVVLNLNLLVLILPTYKRLSHGCVLRFQCCYLIKQPER